jgi:hypothetical protein
MELRPGAPLSAGTLQRPRAKYVSVGAAVLMLHAVICWLLLNKIRGHAGPRIAQGLELLWIPPSPLTAPEQQAEKGSSNASKPPKRKAPERPQATPEASPTPPQNNAITPPIDWQGELAREAGAAASARPDHPHREFDFPRRAPPAAKLPEFAWDRNHTHRVESGGGALVVHINENCVFVMTPLPFVFCRPGAQPANGDLFGHMKDWRAGAVGGAQ